MLTCLLCLEENLNTKYYQLAHRILNNFTIKDSIQEYFKNLEILSSSQSTVICHKCYNSIKDFQDFVIKVNNIHNEYSNQLNHLSSVIQSTVISSQPPSIEDIIIPEEDDLEFNEEYLEEEMIEYDENDDSLQENLINDKFVQIDIEKFSKIDNDAGKTVMKNVLNSEKNSKDLSKFTKITSNKSFFKFQNKSLSSILNNHNFTVEKSSKISKKSHSHKSIQKSPKIIKILPLNTEKVTSIAQYNPNKCNFCSKSFKTSILLQNHIQHAHISISNSPKCPQCDKIFKNKYILKTHMKKHIVEPDKSYECYICKKSLRNLPHLLHHFKYKHDPAHAKSSICHICSKRVTRLDIHERQMHNEEYLQRVKCEICGHWMKKSSLNGHMAGHKETNGFNCKICKKFLKNKNSLLCHMKRIHTIGRFRCEHCEKSFHNENRLIDHVACQHTGNFIHKCRIKDCNKMFRNAGRRRIHERRMHPKEYEKNFKASYLRENLKVST